MRIGITLTSSLDIGQKYIDLTETVAKIFAQKSHGIVYGGTSYGMMKKLAEAYKQHGGTSLCGVLAEDLVAVTKNYEKFDQLDEEYTVATMEDRKRKIIELSDAYLILPGGYGTFEEIGSIIGGQANKLYSKPIAIMNFEGFYDNLFTFLSEMHEKAFSRIAPEELFFSSDNLDEILKFYEGYNKKDLKDKFV
ncbi:Rossman fold protein, TIGR00730 family [Candidatus Roizmanbacteria bacterium RIFCSPLOWO2_01_FULL_42_14]|uniref:Cytokinin riboside 5'-monophosphate phosphoribohydrolase n=3 Tax=Candidatus Roizmaniibacteriota TaxID=1752723 RepID=A0A1F7JXH4_9BACT|nr:MAG: Rossman fold protein, TIGR00730 family [Candidatus Roizmanbacteria bacterium RIFCSPHIGHO2_02_FULL_43_11]OGK51946.1 MAG: Rossman fold protein, TIGR00730 family [Candidatus Roizmanbacteria bacterium RIFCSPLOWO2_01_FULL_42_14]OGK60295.1 MAG: Rossman fold protein, TIGR00730 family [Candidatus Roizmanbacteria bacterium RIFCSPLOWO2_02_FULL_43_10]